MQRYNPKQIEKPLHEINYYTDKGFPIEMYTVTQGNIEPSGRGYMDLHWHEEVYCRDKRKAEIESRWEIIYAG